MVWIYLVAASSGAVFLVPILLRSTEQAVPAGLDSFVGFSLTAFGLTGAFASLFPASFWATLIAALAVGLAAGAIHPEIVTALSPPTQSQKRDQNQDGHRNEDRLASEP